MCQTCPIPELQSLELDHQGSRQEEYFASEMERTSKHGLRIAPLSMHTMSVKLNQRSSIYESEVCSVQILISFSRIQSESEL